MALPVKVRISQQTSTPSGMLVWAEQPVSQSSLNTMGANLNVRPYTGIKPICGYVPTSNLLRRISAAEATDAFKDNPVNIEVPLGYTLVRQGENTDSGLYLDSPNDRVTIEVYKDPAEVCRVQAKIGKKEGLWSDLRALGPAGAQYAKVKPDNPTVRGTLIVTLRSGPPLAVKFTKVSKEE